MHMVTIFLFFVYGLVFGSFYNVVGLRVPNKTFLLTKHSHCYICKQKLGWIELIPVVSFLFQKGTCRSCGNRISSLYPIIELLTGFLFVTAYSLYGWTTMTVFCLIIISLIIIVTISDIVYQKIPNKVLFFFLILLIVYNHFMNITSWRTSVIGAVVAFFLVLVIIIFSKGGMGIGDLKYFTLFGFVFGWSLFLLLFFLSTLYGALINGLLLATKKVNRKTKVAFGPYIGAAALTVLFCGNKLLAIYLSLF
ncbi:prepilin peptidase [Marinilactibacillus kalidii]|uniref:prepilin peptidase n=1 Tax=Marinilactibacillus kalidii TaxID=2820274 RepID=UPI001ABE120E|nr:A24 family peptidase [Marinilactibacillus kalidii]